MQADNVDLIPKSSKLRDTVLCWLGVCHVSRDGPLHHLSDFPIGPTVYSAIPHTIHDGDHAEPRYS